MNTIIMFILLNQYTQKLYFIRRDQKDLAADTNKSAITDCVARENHVINWSGAKILDRRSYRKTRQLSAYGKRPTV